MYEKSLSENSLKRCFSNDSKHSCKGGIPRGSAASVMSAFGISELVSRVTCALTGEQKIISKPMIYILSSLVGAVGFLIPIVANNSEPMSLGSNNMTVELLKAFPQLKCRIKV